MGRPRRHEPRSLDYIAKVAGKRRIERKHLLDSIVDAYNNGFSNCQGIRIELRKREKEKAWFLLTEGQRIIGQIPLPMGFLGSRA